MAMPKLVHHGFLDRCGHLLDASKRRKSCYDDAMNISAPNCYSIELSKDRGSCQSETRQLGQPDSRDRLYTAYCQFLET